MGAFGAGYDAYGAVESRYQYAVEDTLLDEAQSFYAHVAGLCFGVPSCEVIPLPAAEDKAGRGDATVYLTSASSGAVVRLAQPTARVDYKENNASRALHWRAPDSPEMAIEQYSWLHEGLIGPAYQATVPYDLQLQLYPHLGQVCAVSMTGLHYAAHRGAFQKYPAKLTRWTERDGYRYRSQVNFVPVRDLGAVGVAARVVPFDCEALELYRQLEAARLNVRQKRGF